jgi:hypothetical protein
MSSKEMPERLVELRDPVHGHLRLHEIVAPEYIPAVLRGFGRRHPPARRYIVQSLDGMAATLQWARKHKPPMKFASADAHLARLENASLNLHSL